MSEAEGENAQMQPLDFARKEGEASNATIDKFNATIKFSANWGVNVDENHIAIATIQIF